MVVKKRLACEIVAQFHGAQAAHEAEEHFAKVIQRREAPEGGVTIKVPTATVSIAGIPPTILTSQALMLTAELTKVGLTKSRSEARRLLAQGAIEVDGKPVTEDIDVSTLKPGSIIKVGKRRYAKIAGSN
jgi:tyrosyl-tRNA synthetase